ncbi:hypothetical protein UT300005_09330 [Clostridium sp. CTA-5]
MRDRKFVKLRVDMYEDTKFKIIDRMEERDVIHYIWTRLLALAGKVNLEGKLYMSKNIPYTEETLSIEFNRSVEKISLALNVFKDLEMVELTESNVYKIRNFAKHQNIKVKDKIETKDNSIEFNDKENLSYQKSENKEYMEEEFKNITPSIDRKDKTEEKKDLEKQTLKENEKEREKKIKSEDELEKEKKIIEFKNDQNENTILNNIYEKEQKKQFSSTKDLEFSENLLVDKKKNKKISKKNKKTKNSAKEDKEKDSEIFKIDDDDCLGEMCEWEENPKIEGEVVKFFSF